MMRACAWDISVRSEKALQREKGRINNGGKESDRRKKRLKGNQIEIPRRRYRGCSRYGVYKWKAMNRWIRGKEIKAEAEWTARWVFRYDKSPRKSPFLPFFSVFSAPHSASVFAVPLLPAPFLILSPSSHPFCSFSFLSFFPPYGFSRRSRATFRLPDRYLDERIRAERDGERHPSRMNFPSTVIEMPFSAYEVSCTTRGYSEMFQQPTAFR